MRESISSVTLSEQPYLFFHGRLTSSSNQRMLSGGVDFLSFFWSIVPRRATKTLSATIPVVADKLIALDAPSACSDDWTSARSRTTLCVTSL
jgi:hypothetical protein